MHSAASKRLGLIQSNIQGAFANRPSVAIQGIILVIQQRELVVANIQSQSWQHNKKKMEKYDISHF